MVLSRTITFDLANRSYAEGDLFSSNAQGNFFSTISTSSWPVFKFICACVTCVVIYHLTRPDSLRDVPGPWLAKYTSLLLAYHTRTGKRYLYVDSLHKKYGPLVRLAPNSVSCSSPSAPSVIYAQGALSLPKSPFYRAFYVDGTPSLFSTQDRAGHAQKRRVLAHPFSPASVRDLERWIKIRVAKMIEGLDARCNGLGVEEEDPGRAERSVGESTPAGTAVGRGCTLDILMWLNFLTFDVISDLAFGQPLGMLERESDILRVNHVHNVDESLRKPGGEEYGVASMIDFRGRTAAFLGLFPFILPGSWLAPLVMYTPDGFTRRGLRGTEALFQIATRCVKDRLSNGTRGERGDLLDRLIAYRDDKGDEVREEDIVTEAMLLLTAGSDTTANSTAAILFYILHNPRVLHKVRAELEEALFLSSLTNDQPEETDGVVAYDQIKNLRYLAATIDEGLRMFATNAFGLPRIVPEGRSVVIGGREFVEGVELSAPAYTIQHDPMVWGDPEVFRPERWIDDADCPDIRHGINHGGRKSSSELKKYVLAFGMGPRACIGKNLAFLQIQILLATLLTRYDFQLRDDKLKSVEGFMHKPVDVWVTIRWRVRS